MSEAIAEFDETILELRIPMRGYESVATANLKPTNKVTNPHAGL